MAGDTSSLIQDLRATLGRLELALGSVSESILWVGEDLRVHWCNRAFDQLVGRPHIQILGAPALPLLPLTCDGQLIPPERHPIRRLLEDRALLPTRYRLQRGDVSLAVEISGSPFLPDSAAVTAVVVIRDITSEVAAEDMLRDQQAQEHEAAELKSQFTSMVSHELRTPLAAMKEAVDLVMDGTAGPTTAAQQEFLQIAKRNIDRLARLIHDVLDFQKLEAGRMTFDLRPCDVGVAIREVVQGFTAVAAKKGLQLIVEPDRTPLVTADADKITQVLTNLINNAMKFTERGAIRVSARRQGAAVEVAVRDDGPGIAPEDQQRLFQSFTQLPTGGGRAVGGTGLGLAICRKIIAYHGGEIGVRSTPGQGSTFYFTLPLVNKE